MTTDEPLGQLERGFSRAGLPLFIAERSAAGGDQQGPWAPGSRDSPTAYAR